MVTERTKLCRECEGEGWVYDMLGGCSDPECCGGPFQIRCTACDSNWPDDDEEDEEK